MMSFVKNLEVDEIRNGFLVTSNRKRLWNKQIEIILEFGRVCDKHGLRWFIGWGTLLGAARHRGFIPWDDDIDVTMFRTDYEKFKQIAPKEFRYPYYFNVWYDNDDPTDEQLDLWWPHTPFSKLRDSRTVMIEFPKRPTINQGIWLDIFPMDALPPFDESPDPQAQIAARRVQDDLFMATCMPTFAPMISSQPKRFHVKIYPPQLLAISKMPLRQKGKIYEDSMLQSDLNSKFVACTKILPDYISQKNSRLERAWFDETIYLPFEETSLPAPKEFDKALTALYGDWRVGKIRKAHSENYSANISYKKYFESLGKPDGDQTRENSLDQNMLLDEFRDGSLVSTWKKKIWRKKLDLILELARVCEKLDLKFWASGGTLYAARKLHGFDPLNDFVTLEMSRDDFEKLEFHFPYQLVGKKLMDLRTSMIESPEEKDRPQGIFIEIQTTEKSPAEIEYLPFEFTSIPTPKDRETPDRIERKFNGAMSADISYLEYFSKIAK